MSKCNLSIRLDRSDRNYKVGDTITGVVHVNVDKEVKCRALTIKNLWKTHGRGNIDSDVKFTDTIFSGTWSPGAYEYPFSIVVEEFPVSYHGNYINIDWYLEARADIPWAIDPKCKADYLLTRSAQPNISDLAHDKNRPHVPVFKNTNSSPSHILAALSFILLAVGIVMSLTILRSETESGLLVIVPVILFFGLISSIYFVRRFMVHSKLGSIMCKVTPQEILPGEEFAVSVGFRPQSNGLINKIGFTIIGTEIVSSGSGSNRKTYRKVVFRKAVSLKGNCDFRAGKYLYEEGKCIIPADAGPSFKSNNNEIKWSVVTHIDIDSWPDWKESRPILVI